MTALSNEDMHVTSKNMDSRTIPSYMGDMHRVEYAALSPGPDLDRMNLVVLNNIARFLEELPTNSPINLFASVRRIVTFSSVRATYGPGNPLDRDAALFDDFWEFESDLKWLLLDVFPSVTVKEAHRARQRLISAFLRYYDEEEHLRASAVVQERFKVAAKFGQPLRTVAAFDVGILFGLLANTLPTIFWILVHVYTKSSLLAKIREETAHMVSATRSTFAIHLPSDSHLRRTCPILTSTFHEVLRHTSSSLSSGRYVLEDTMLAPPPSTSNLHPRPFLLRAGSSVQLPAFSIHYSTIPSSPYSPNPTEFLPSRFADLSVPEPERNMYGDFRAFGGGTTLCPGRKFAYMKVIGFVTMFVNLFELEGLSGVPAQEVSKIAMAVSKPVQDVSVRLIRRPETAGKTLQVLVGQI